MGMNDIETAALVAGGHAFGECHLTTSGFNGPWTTTPSVWSYEFLSATLNEEWEKHTINGGPVQWRTVNRDSPFKDTMRLTSDLAFKQDEIYKAILEGWVETPANLDTEFAKAWNKLVTSGNKYANGRKCEGGIFVAPGETDAASLPSPVLLVGLFGSISSLWWS